MLLRRAQLQTHLILGLYNVMQHNGEIFASLFRIKISSVHVAHASCSIGSEGREWVNSFEVGLLEHSIKASSGTPPENESCDFATPACNKATEK